jgi:hypothetical protein
MIINAAKKRLDACLLGNETDFIPNGMINPFQNGK